MADRILTWNFHRRTGNDEQNVPAYFMESDYEPTGLRIHAGTAPSLEDAEFDILDDGASIFVDRGVGLLDSTSGQTEFVSQTTVQLGKGETEEQDADEFNNTPIAAGSWLTLDVVKDGAGRNFTVQLELDKVSDDSEVDEE